MKGLLKAKSPTSQLVTFLGITLVSMIVLGQIGALIVGWINGVDLGEMGAMADGTVKSPKMVSVIVGLQVVQFIAMFLIPSILCSYLFSERPMSHIGLKPPHSTLLFVFGVLSIATIYSFSQWLGLLNRDILFPESLQNWIDKKEAGAEKSMRAMLEQQSVASLITNLIVIAGMASIGEELLLRGMLQRILIRMFRSPWAGIIIAAIIFSAMHIQFKGFLPRFVLGILLGAIYWYSGSLWTSIAAHFFYNGSQILLVYFYPELLDSNASSVSADLVKAIPAALIGLLLTMILLHLMIKRSKTNYEEVYAEELNAKDHPF